MSEPRRWKDAADAPVGMRELLGSARASHPLDEAAFRRGRERLARISAAPVAIAAASVWSKSTAAAVIGLAALGTVVAIEGHRRADTAPGTPFVALAPSSLPKHPPVPAPSTAVPPTVAPPPRPAPTMVPKAKRTVAEPAADAPSTTPSAMPWIPEEPARAKSSLAEELRLLEAARSDMARRPEVALTRIAEHRAIYPSGVLAAERDLMELDALRRSGRQRDARQRARAWLAREPNGIHAARVREILKTLE